MKFHNKYSLLFFIVTVTFSTNFEVAYAADNVEQMFDEAMTKRDTGKIFEAIELFENLLSTRPDLNRARLELAVAYHAASRYQDALREFKIVLDDPKTPESVRLSILAYLGQLTSDEMKPEAFHRLSYYSKVGVIHNSNVNVTPGKGEILFPNWTNTSQGEISSAGLDFHLNAGHRYSRKKPVDVDGAATRFEWQSQASLAGNIYEKTSDYDLYITSLSTGPAFISPGRWRTLIELRADHIVLGSSTLATFYSFNPVVVFDLGHYRSVTLEASYRDHNYDDAVDAGREGEETMVGAGYTTLIDPEEGIGLEAGFRLSDNDAELAEFGYSNRELYLSGFITTDIGSNVYAKMSSRSFEYDGPDSIAGIIRDETENHMAVGYNQDLKQGWLQGWTLNAELSHTDNSSNINAYDYQRTMATVNVSRYF